MGTTETSKYMCARTTRNGQCRGKSLRYNVGPLNLTLCRRHDRLYTEEREAAMGRVLFQHDQGLHGEGEERREFAKRYVSGEFYLTCSKCNDELKSEDLGVSPEDVDVAERIQYRMDESPKELKQAKDHFMQYWPTNPKTAISSYAVDVIGAEYEEDLWQSVRAEMKQERYDEDHKAYKPNLVQAYNKVRDQVVNRLLRNHLDHEAERVAASQFVRAGDRW